MSIKIAINGMGRIGRAAFRIIHDRKELEIVAINDLSEPKNTAYLIKHDSVFGTWERQVEPKEKEILIDGKKIAYLQESDPEKLPWKDLGIDVVLECTGVFNKSEKAIKHINAGAKLVILSAPPKSDDIKILLMGCNEKEFNPAKHQIISNASCTSKLLSPGN